jgi:uncharacterized membrane protein
MSSPTATGDSTAKETHIVLAMGLGSIVLAAAMSGQGVLALIYGDFASPWQPIPQWLPWRQGVAYLSGVVMLAGGVGLCIKPSAMRSAGVLTIDLMLCWVLPQALKVAAGPVMSVGSWLGLCETLAVTSGAGSPTPPERATSSPASQFYLPSVHGWPRRSRR